MLLVEVSLGAPLFFLSDAVLPARKERIPTITSPLIADFFGSFLVLKSTFGF